MWNHSQAMADEFARRGVPRVTFSGGEMADIIAYLYFVNYASVRARPERGGVLFVDKCSPCHSIGGGRQVGPDLQTAPGLNDPLAIMSAMWNHSFAMEQELRRHGLAWPRLEPGDAADLTAFLLSRTRMRSSHRYLRSASRIFANGRAYAAGGLCAFDAASALVYASLALAVSPSFSYA